MYNNNITMTQTEYALLNKEKRVLNFKNDPMYYFFKLALNITKKLQEIFYILIII